MRHYVDHAASTPLRACVQQAMAHALEMPGNPSSLHTSGRRARALLEDAREQLADAVGAHPEEIVFTSGGTEADRLVIDGGAAWGAAHGRPCVAASTVEHPAITEAVRALGDHARWLAVDGEGRILPGELDRIGREVAWASVQWVNNEIGVVQDMPAFVAECRRAGVRAHSDAVQAVGHLGVHFTDTGLDAMSISAHKLGGPVGVGALVVRRGAPLGVVSPGGGQERRLRSGTVPVALAVGFAAAAAEATATLTSEGQRLAGLRNRLVSGLSVLDGVRVNGTGVTSPAIVHITCAGCRADDLLLLLDAVGIDCSTGAACTAGVHRPSEVLLAMGRSEADAVGSLRFSLGHTSTEADVEAVLAALPDALDRARATPSWAP